MSAIDLITVSPSVLKAKEDQRPILALESTVITHGLPFPKNLEIATALEALVRAGGVVPATCAVLDGIAVVGVNEVQMRQLADEGALRRKVSIRDLGLVQGIGGTTVAATLALAAHTGVEVFATGGIGGVHREAPYDVSSDLPALARYPVIVICSGAKSLLDLARTHEWLETFGIPVIGYGTETFPAFYSRSSGLPVDYVTESPSEIAQIWSRRRALRLSQGMLVCVPVPKEDEWPADEAEPVIAKALEESMRQRIVGKAVTPFLLQEVAARSGGKSLRANLSLLKNNAIQGAAVARALSLLH